MTTPFYYCTTYVLDKAHFSETFDESSSLKIPITAYLKATGLILLGFAFLYFTELNRYVAWFIVVLGVVDALSVYFRKPWWLARQLISEAANTELTLSIDDNAVSSKSISVESKILWADVIKIEQTKQGWLLYHRAGKSYLSSRCLSEAANEFIHAHALIKSEI